MKPTAAMLVVLLGVLGVQVAHAADQGAPNAVPTIEVTGNGEVVVDPDRATVTIVVETQNATSAGAAAANAHLTAAVTGALVTAGAARSDVVTASYTVLAQYQYPNNAPPKRLGYQAQTTMRVSVRQLAVLGKWMDAALDAGASRVENIEFDSGQIASARLGALAKAVADARAEAETIAKAAGGSLGPLQQISTESTSSPRFAVPGALQEAVMTAQRRPAEETHIEPSPLHINAVVTAGWRFDP